MRIISSREKEILQKISEGFSTKEIACILYVSYDTVLTHRKNLIKKLNVRNAASLVRRGFECGYLNVGNY